MHGIKDTLSPHTETMKLFQALNKDVVGHMNLSEKMTHNKMKKDRDIIKPMKMFLK